MTFQNELKPSLDDALEHYGVKGMKWGVRKTTSSELKTAKKNNKAAEKAASKDPNFKREVKLTREAKGVDVVSNLDFEITEKGKVFTGKILGDFEDSTGKRVSEDFGNAVLKTALKQNNRAELAKIGAVYATAMVALVVVS